ncbi:hypothetical protein GT352_27940 [Streptomyces sp. SID1046]|uniref:hypothetical protein n=1 Tax=Streptomyces sp. SID1046 TaxID=2690249 RepID=UPI00136CC19E|nr:hypothetical protein [Streptomyces sp. SID1046]MYV77732.1 hypothetical protein [Streptomyces sp. SID1046]
MTAPTQVLSALLCDPDAAVQMAGPLLRSLDLTDRDPLAWITDPNLRQSIADGFIDIPDDLLGGRP